MKKVIAGESVPSVIHVPTLVLTKEVLDPGHRSRPEIREVKQLRRLQTSWSRQGAFWRAAPADGDGHGYQPRGAPPPPDDPRPRRRDPARKPDRARHPGRRAVDRLALLPQPVECLQHPAGDLGHRHPRLRLHLRHRGRRHRSLGRLRARLLGGRLGPLGQCHRPALALRHRLRPAGGRALRRDQRAADRPRPHPGLHRDARHAGRRARGGAGADQRPAGLWPAGAHRLARPGSAARRAGAGDHLHPGRRS